MPRARDDDTLSERPTLGRTEPEKEKPAGANCAWSEEDAERETLDRPADAGEAGVMTLTGRYKVLRRLGEGGMGSVWLAEDLKLDGRRVAIKMLPAVLAGKKTAFRQVKQEALMAMKLAHPNIATVRAFEEEEGGVPFLVMDYIDGTGLDDILAEKGKLSEEETVRLLAPVAAALDYAHSKGVVHRDVKPGNVIVDKNGTPFMLDFGIAKEIQETMTRVTGRFSSGTLMYMSPEQLHGRAPKATQDVYSFAAMGYECLRGTPPFSRGQIEYQIDHDAPEPLEEGVASRALREGIMAGLAKEAKKRPGSCAGVLGESGANDGAIRPGEPENGIMFGRTDRPESLPKHGPLGRRPEEVRGHVARWIGFLAVILLVAVVAAVSWWWSERTRLENEKARLEGTSRDAQDRQMALEKEKSQLQETAQKAADEAAEAKAAKEQLEQERQQQGAEAWEVAEEARNKAEEETQRQRDAEEVQRRQREEEEARQREQEGQLAELRSQIALSNEFASRRTDDSFVDGDRLNEKMQKIIISSLEFRQANIFDVVNYLVDASVTADPDKEGVNIILNLGDSGGSSAAAAPAASTSSDGFDDWGDFGGDDFGASSSSSFSSGSSGGVTPITLNLRRISMLDAIKCITEVAGLKYCVEDTAVIITRYPTSRTDSAYGLGHGAYPGKTESITLPGGAEMEMVWCPAGSFTMGSPEEEEGRNNDETQHRVTLTKGFWIAKYEVTQNQWNSVMGLSASRFKGENLPVEKVSWNDAKEFCRKTGLRLPTEAEWEYACRAGSGTAYFWGNALNGDHTNCDGNYPCGTTVKGPYKQKTTPVGSYAPNAWGLYDMHGNVWEWCEDWYGAYPSGAATNPTGPSAGSYRVLRGGGWLAFAWCCRSAERNNLLDPALWNVSYGFRPCFSAGLP